MNNYGFNRYPLYQWFTLLSITVLIALNNGGCGENPVDLTDEKEAVGLIITDETGEILRVVDDSVIGSFPSLQLSDTSNVFHITFIDEGGDPFTPEGPEHKPEYSLAENSIASLLLDSNDIWSFSLRGDSIGETTLTITLLHGVHSDYDSPELPISVEE